MIILLTVSLLLNLVSGCLAIRYYYKLHRTQQLFDHLIMEWDDNHLTPEDLESIITIYNTTP